MSRLSLKGLLVVTLAAAAAASATFHSGSARAASTSFALPDCVGKPEVKPKDVTVACGDANFTIEKLQWTGWGEPFAAGMGTASVNDCKPYCAAGHFHNYPVVVIVDGKQRCPNGQPAYVKLTYAFIGASPFPANARAADASISFPCRPRT